MDELTRQEQQRRTNEVSAAARLLDAVERLTGEQAGYLHTRDVAIVYTRMADLIERAADERGKLIAYAREMEEIARYAQRANRMVEDVDVLRAEAGVTAILEASDGE